MCLSSCALGFALLFKFDLWSMWPIIRRCPIIPVGYQLQIDSNLGYVHSQTGKEWAFLLLHWLREVLCLVSLPLLHPTALLGTRLKFELCSLFFSLLPSLNPRRCSLAFAFSVPAVLRSYSLSFPSKASVLLVKYYRCCFGPYVVEEFWVFSLAKQVSSRINWIYQSCLVSWKGD